MPQPYRNPFDLWHLLSLDAPTVAALWCWTLGRAAGLRLPWTAPWMLALGAWLLYVSDRLLDGSLARDPGALRERHRFHQQHRRTFLVSAAVVSAVLLWLVATRLPARVLHEDLCLGACALAYLAVVHLVPSTWVRCFPKELAVAVVFATATAVPAWARMNPQAPASTQFLALVALFAAICWINCVAIEAWETEGSGPAVRSSSTQWLGAQLPVACGCLALVAFAMAVYWLSEPAERHRLGAAAASIGISALLFATLSRARQRISPLRLRVAADAVLLTPLLFLSVLR